MGPVVVFRPTSSQASAVFAWVVALVLLVGTVLADDVSSVLALVAFPLTIAAFAWAVLWRPFVQVEADHVVVANVLRTITVPYPLIESMETRWGLRLLTADGAVDAWGAPARSAFARRRARRHADGRPPTIPEELVSTRVVGPVRHRSDAALVADVVDLRRRALPATLSEQPAHVSRSVNVREVALLVGSLALLAVALTT